MSDGALRFGTVTEDPALALPPGSQIHFVALLMNTPIQGPSRLESWESLNGMVLGISFSDISAHQIDGSAVIVGPGIALCATHVLEPRLESLLTGVEAMMCFTVAPSGVQVWKVNKITLVPNSDLAILGLAFASALPSKSTFYKSVITTRPPEDGEHLTIFGFKPFERTFPRTDTAATLAAGVVVCTGKVTKCYPMGRDKAMLPWPVVELDCPSWGGMSGGPVFDQTGKVVGLLTTSFSTEDTFGPSYASLLTPALNVRFQGGWPSELFPSSTTLCEMGRALCTID